MNVKRVLPPSKRKTVSALSRKGAIPVGCIERDGALIPALCAEPAAGNFPQNVRLATFAKKRGKWIVLADDGIYYSIDGAAEFNKSRFEITFTSPFFFETDDGDTCLAGDSQVFIARASMNSVAEFNHNVKKGVAKNGRLFAVDRENPYKLRWSGGKDGFDWEQSIDGAGYCILSQTRGRICDLIVYKQRVIIVCERGLAYLNAYGNTENFRLVYVDGLMEEVYENTAATVGGKLVLCAGDKLYAYDGVSAEKLDVALACDIKEPTFAIGAGEDYYLCAKSRALGRKVVFVVNVRDKTAYIVDIPAVTLCQNDGIYCFTETEAAILKSGGKFTYESGSFNFGKNKPVCLTSLHMGNSASVDAEVWADGRKRTIYGVNGYCRPKLTGSSFKVVIRSGGEVRGVNAVAEVNGEN